MFRKYDKIEAIHKEDCDGILDGLVNVTEKIDGANTSIWVDIDGIHTGSRNQDITGGSFRGFNEYVNNHEGILLLLKDHPNFHLYGEWLVRHSVQYNETAYSQWYMFDIFDIDAERFYPFCDVEYMAQKYGILTPHNFGDFTRPTIEELQELTGKSFIGDKGEGIVIRNPAFVNKWGRTPYAKIVTKEFKEDNGIIFGGNNKHSESYWEMYIVQKYVTMATVRKIMNKVNSMGDRECDERDTPQIVGMVMNDIIVENAWEIFKKIPTVNNRVLKNLISKKVVRMYKDILHGFESVAYEEGKEAPEVSDYEGSPMIG